MRADTASTSRSAGSSRRRTRCCSGWPTSPGGSRSGAFRGAAARAGTAGRSGGARSPGGSAWIPTTCATSSPATRDAPALRARAAGNAASLMRRAARIARVGGPGAVRAASPDARGGRALPRAAAARRALPERLRARRRARHAARRLGSPQADYVRAAQALGIHRRCLVVSWDNLTNKGLIREVPELRARLERGPGARGGRAARDPARSGRASTGATPTTTGSTGRRAARREDVLRRSRPATPTARIVLYVCSSPFIAPRRGRVRPPLGRGPARARTTALRTAGVLVRPHPRNAAQWRGVDARTTGRPTRLAAARRGAARRQRAPELLRLDPPRRRRRRHQHERADRERDRRPAGPHACSPTSSATPRRARCTSST